MTNDLIAPYSIVTFASIEGGGVPHRDHRIALPVAREHLSASIEGGGVPHRDFRRSSALRDRRMASIEGGGVPHRDPQVGKHAAADASASIEGGGVPHRDTPPTPQPPPKFLRFNRGWGGSPP